MYDTRSSRPLTIWQDRAAFSTELVPLRGPFGTSFGGIFTTMNETTLRRSFSPRFLCLIAITIAWSGCMGSSQQDFVGSKRLDGLVPYAREAVEKVVNDKFGSPGELRCPTTTVIETGDVRGSVVLNEDRAEKETIETLNLKSEMALEEVPTLSSKSIRFVPTLDYQFAALEALNEKENFQIQEYIQALLSQSDSVSLNSDNTEFTLSQPVKAAAVNESGFVLNECRSLYRGQELYMLHCVHCHGVSGWRCRNLHALVQAAQRVEPERSDQLCQIPLVPRGAGKSSDQ